MKNNSAPPLPTAKRTGVVYKFSCPYPHREAEDYIGLTTTTINRRMTMHAQTGSIKNHYVDCHNIIPTRAQILDNISIISQADNKQKLYIKEAIFILQCAPNINKQYDNFTNVLKLYKSRNIPPNQPSNSTVTYPTVTQSPISQGSTHTLNPEINPPTSSFLSTNHQVSPQISQRISQLLSNARITPEPSTENSDAAIHTPISHRLRPRRI